MPAPSATVDPAISGGASVNRDLTPAEMFALLRAARTVTGSDATDPVMVSAIAWLEAHDVEGIRR